MNLALTILFLWLGMALLYVAFHPLSLETSKGAPTDILRALQNKIAGRGTSSLGESAGEVTGDLLAGGAGKLVGKAPGKTN